jgi:hypothetical protein
MGKIESGASKQARAAMIAAVTRSTSNKDPGVERGQKAQNMPEAVREAPAGIGGQSTVAITFTDRLDGQ